MGFENTLLQQHSSALVFDGINQYPIYSLFFQSRIKLPETLLQCFLGASEVQADEAVPFGAEHGTHIDPDFGVI